MIRGLLVVCLLLLVSHASAQTPDEGEQPASSAEAHYARGRALYADERYEEAAGAFAEAYAADPQPRFIYNRAQAERLGGDCTAATESYHAFLATEPIQELRDKTERNLEHCRTELAKRPAPVPSPDPIAPAPPPPPPPPPPPHFLTDVAGGMLFGGGLVVAAVGGGVLAWSFTRENDARSGSSDTYGDHVDAIAAAEASRVAGIVMLSAGAALLIGGIVRYGLFDGGEAESALTVGCTLPLGLRCTF